jgi:hypothetical protein
MKRHKIRVDGAVGYIADGERLIADSNGKSKNCIQTGQSGSP